MLLVSTLLRGRVLSSFFSVSAWFWSLCLLTGLGGWVGMLTFIATARFSCTSIHTGTYKS